MTVVEYAPLPPQNLEAEEALLGAVLMSGALGKTTAIERVMEVLESNGADKFYRDGHGKIYDACRALYLGGKVPDSLLLETYLREQGQLEQIGGRMRLVELSILATMTSNVGHYAELVRGEWARRGVLNALNVSRQEILDGAAADGALAGAESRLLDVRGAIDGAQRTHVSRAIDVLQDYDALVKSPPALDSGVAAAFSFLGRLAPGRLYVLAGYTAHGKTALSIQFLRAACKGGTRVGFISLEMSTADLADRLVSSYGIPYRACQEKRFVAPWDEKYREAMTNLATLNFDIVDDPAADATAIARYTKVGGYEALIVDHLHRLDWVERRQLEREVRSLTNLARTAEIPIVLLTQLSRGKGDRPFPRPTLASLRDTSVIEQEAWAVWFVYRHPNKETGDPTNEAELITAKNRSGPLGTTSLWFDAPRVRYVQVDEVHAG